MRDKLATRLIVIDGLPGSGKSTNGEWLAKQLQQQGESAYFLAESDLSHPLWWYEYWDGENYLPPDFDHAPVEIFIQTSLQRWKDFVAGLKDADHIYIVESFSFQNTIAMFLMGGAESSRLVEYAREVQYLVRELNPVLFYFYQPDVASALQRICDLRGQEFEEELLQNMERFPYLRQRDLKGLDGITVLWKDIRALTDALFEEYTIRKLKIDVSAGNWGNYRQRMLGFLNLI